ncbi:phosphatidylinositide phosphatase SAC1 [Agrilus planipennis]|uniref:Phosphatidylinositol-3-phosphatase SAC1 n=1 Tax=Agrilus planipennis TaxID=224129 RepID=A0A1W4WWB0_AGRPL|nr:phosphatidylinositide phosphatase SAC1 [Agrilus planipennis]
MNSFKVHEDINLYITKDKFYLESKSSSAVLIIDRISELLSIQNDTKSIPTSCTWKVIYGLLGSVPLLAGSYLIVATGREHVGHIAGHSIWRLTNFELIPYLRSTLHLNQQQLEDNQAYVTMVEQVLNTPNFYFSYTYDLSHTMQRLHETDPTFLNQSLLERADQRFIWNKYLLSSFYDPVYHKFCLPLIHGFVSINICTINAASFSWSIISRRSIYRAGTRWFKRGIDKNANVGNFVETEQIVEYEGDRYSFVQLRGSVPLFWGQTPNLLYKPPIQITEEDQELAKQVCAKHLESLTLMYGKVVLIDLIDHKGMEEKLQLDFENTVKSLNFSSVHYEPFDFHKECRHMRWDRLSILVDRVANDQDEMGYFLLMRDGSLASLQEGVFRTNCIDCLDRTNVVQSILARRSLINVLKKLGVLQPLQTTEDYPNFEYLFKQVWADNADYISIQYSGTGALKTDFTRTGKRTRVGMLYDGINSLTRYYKNNFSDGFRQDAIDLFLGNCKVKYPLKVERGWRYVTMPSVLLVAFAMFVACATLPSEHSSESLLFLLFWGCMVATTSAAILRHGTEFVDVPRLTTST